MDRSLLEARVSALVRKRDDRAILACTDALSLADELGVDAGEIGSFCNERKIKIVVCRLGCFK
jgi:hypothetical protein